MTQPTIPEGKIRPGIVAISKCVVHTACKKLLRVCMIEGGSDIVEARVVNELDGGHLLVLVRERGAAVLVSNVSKFPFSGWSCSSIMNWFLVCLCCFCSRIEWSTEDTVKGISTPNRNFGGNSCLVPVIVHSF